MKEKKVVPLQEQISLNSSLMNIRLLFLFVSIFFISCDIRKPFFVCTIENRSSDSVYVLVGRPEEWNSYLPSYRDYDEENDGYTALLAPGQKEEFGEWYYVFEDGDRWRFGFLKIKTIHELTWEVIQKKDTLDRLLVYSLEDLKATGYKIVYE